MIPENEVTMEKIINNIKYPVCVFERNYKLNTNSKRQNINTIGKCTHSHTCVSNVHIMPLS